MNDELMDQLQNFDPVMSDPSPTAGSLRFTSIKDQVMNIDVGQNTDSDSQPNRKVYKQRRFQTLAGAAAAVVAITVGVSVTGPGATPSAAEEIQAAADGLGENTDLRVSITSTNPVALEGLDSNGELLIEIDDDTYRVVGEIEGEAFEIIDNGETSWWMSNGEVQEAPEYEENSPAEKIWDNDAFTDIISEGTETVNSVEATRYQIEVDDVARAALSELPNDTLWQFGFYPQDHETVSTILALEEVNSFTIWISDDLVHQVEVDPNQGKTTTSFFDFNDDINVVAPE